MAAKLGQFTLDKTGKGQFLRGNQRNLAGEGIVLKIPSPQRVASVSNLCNGQCQWAGNMGNRDCYTKGEGVGKISNIPKGLWLEKCWGRGEKG